MAQYNLHQLDQLLGPSNNIDPSVRQSIIDYLQDDGLLHGHNSTVDVGDLSDPNAQVLFLTTPINSVDTSAYPNLDVIIGEDANLTVTGSSRRNHCDGYEQ